jgi:hypothetical protein
VFLSLFSARKRLVVAFICIILFIGFIFVIWGIKQGRFFSRATTVSGQTFSDIPDDYWAFNEVEAVYRANIVGGYGDGTFRPEVVVTRDQMAVFISRAVAGGDSKVPAGPATPSFKDVPKDYWAYKYIEYAKTKGIVGGYPDGTYHPTEKVTRDQLAVYVARAMVAYPSGDKNLVSNASFENRNGNTFDQWTKTDGITLAASADAKDGKTGLLLTRQSSTTVAWPEMSQVTPTSISPNTVYTLSYYGKTGVSSGFRLRISDNQNYYLCSDLKWYLNGCNNPSWINQSLTGTWTRYSKKFTTRSTAASITLRFNSYTTGKAYLLDAVQLEKGTAATDFVVQAIDTIPPGPATPTYEDVPSTNWAYKFIEYLAQNNIPNTYADGKYHPADNATRAQMAVFVTRGFDLISQYLIANISGKVTDSTGAALPNAYLVFDEGEAIVKTDASGNYTLPDFDAGIHEVQIFDQNGYEYIAKNADGTININIMGLSLDFGNQTINFAGLIKQ